MKDNLSVEYVKSILSYEPVSGKLIWKKNRFRRFVGQEAGTINARGYRRVSIGNQTYAAHRLAWVIYHNKWPVNELDHIDGCPDNNSIENLRDVTREQNGKNRRVNKNNSSGYKGVSYINRFKRWRASIKVSGRSIILGTFKDPEMAHLAYCEAAALYYGEYERVA